MWSRPESYFNELRRPAMRTPQWHWALRTIPLCLPNSVWRDWARTWRKQEPGTKRPRVLAQRKQHGGWPFLLIVSFAPAQWPLSKDLLGRMISWRLQERAFGGLDRESLSFLDSLARHGGSPRRRLKPGTVLVHAAIPTSIEPRSSLSSRRDQRKTPARRPNHACGSSTAARRSLKELYHPINRCANKWDMSTPPDR